MNAPLAVVVRRLSDQGGTERFTLGFVRWLVADGQSVDVWCAGVDVRVPGVTVRPLKAGGRGRIARLLSLSGAARRVPRERYRAVVGMLRAPGFDVFRAGGGCHAAWMRARGWSLADQVELSADRAAVTTARAVVVNSEMAGRELTAEYGVAPERVRLVRNGVDLERFRPRPDVTLSAPGPPKPGPPTLRPPTLRPPLPRPLVGFIGHGWARKGLPAALTAIARLPDVHLAVWGRERHPERYHRLTRRLGVSERVHFCGEAPRPEDVLPALDAFVLPTRYDPFANVCLEALACGVPVVTSGRNGAAEVLPAPWLVVDDPADDAGIAAAVERVLLQPGLREDARQAAASLPAERAFAELSALVQELSP